MPRQARQPANFRDFTERKNIAGGDSNHPGEILSSDDLQLVQGITRRVFLKSSAGAIAGVYLSTLVGCGGGGQDIRGYQISNTVVTTAQRVLSFPVPPKPSGPNSGTGLYPTELHKISQYATYGYGDWTFGGNLPIVKRYELIPGYSNPAPVRVKQFANFFAFTDIHITDKEAPNQLIYLQQEDPVFGAPGSSLYSPVMLYTTHVLDAAIQTVNALHSQQPFDFGISLGDACNSSGYNELRWYLDVIDGKVITPSSGAHLGAASIDYQKPFRAAGLNSAIPWYQVLGNHDHFMIGSVAIDADPSLGLNQAYTSSDVFSCGDLIRPNSGIFPCVYDTTLSINERDYYMGVLDGSTPYGDIIDTGTVGSIDPPPTITADPNRRPVTRVQWVREFFNSSSSPAGHGFGLVDSGMPAGFACYSFVPKSQIPLKIICLDDTQSETDGSHDIHGHGFLDATRLQWLQNELAAGQTANQLMIIAAHIPICVGAIGSDIEWWESDKDPNAVEQNACSSTDLITLLRGTPNLLMWVAGHRHLNHVKGFNFTAYPSMFPGAQPYNNFWQVETSSLRDLPQQFRTFTVYLNSDYTISIVVVNVDPAVAQDTPAATSRAYSVATQQILQTNLLSNNPNVQSVTFNSVVTPVETMDPSRPQDGTTDPTIQWTTVSGVPYCASYNAELFLQLTPTMISVLKARFPNP